MGCAKGGRKDSQTKQNSPPKVSQTEKGDRHAGPLAKSIPQTPSMDAIQPARRKTHKLLFSIITGFGVCLMI